LEVVRENVAIVAALTPSIQQALKAAEDSLHHLRELLLASQSIGEMFDKK
jgi:hypothetical protein